MNLKKQYQEVFKRLDAIDFNRLYQGFKKYEFALYNEEEVCYKGELFPKTLEFTSNTAIMYKGGWTAIYLVDENDDIDILSSKIVNKMFCAYQKDHHETRYAKELESLQKYEYTLDNLSSKYQENLLIVSLFKNGFNKEVWERLLSYKKERSLNESYSFNYECMIEQVEGSRTYVELEALRILNKEKYDEKIKDIILKLCEKSYLFPIRRSLYSSGAILLSIIFSNKIEIDLSFSNKCYMQKLLENSKEAKVPTDKSINAYIESYFDRIDNLIARKNEHDIIKEGDFDLIGLNVRDAKFHKNFIYTTYFLQYKDKDIVTLFGDYLIELKDNKIKVIYKEID